MKLSRRMLITTLILLTFLAGIPPLTGINESTISMKATYPTRLFQNQTGTDDIPPYLSILSPSEGDSVEYGVVEISFEVRDNIAIRTLKLQIEERVFTVYEHDRPYQWRPTRDGWFTLTLSCTDYALNTATESIRVRVVVEIEVDEILIIPVIIGLIALASISYKHKFENSREWLEDPDFASKVKVPVHYLLRSKLVGKAKDKKER